MTVRRRHILLRTFVAGLLAGFCVTSAAVAQTAPASPSPVVETSYGRIQGIAESDGLLVFRGIPYASDTGGEARFLPARDRQPWPEVRDASKYGPYCPQIAFMPGFENQSEDCLLANIWTPSLSGKRPVMVWFHGGAYNATSELAEGAQLAQRGDVVVVTVNHRLNAFGFLQLGPEFGTEYAGSANVGMLDLAKSLEWVKANIARFGGDPDNVTIFGRSGGGSKVAHAFAMPAFSGLFERGIVMAGHDLWKENRREDSVEASSRILAELDLQPGDMQRLQTLSTEQILSAFGSVKTRTAPSPAWGHNPWINYDLLAPVVDGVTLTEPPLRAIAAGAGARVPMMLGIARFEHWYRVGAEEKFGWMSDHELAEMLGAYLGPKAPGIIESYRQTSPWASPSTLLAEIVTDRDWWIPHVRLAEARAAAGAPAHVYFFNAGAGANVPFDLVMGQSSGASEHAQALAGQVTDAFVSFARDGNPNHPRLPQWRPYTLESREVMILDYNSELRRDPWMDRRLVWDE